MIKPELQERIILGVDPGTRYMGYGLIMIKGKEVKLMQYGVINLTKYTNHEIKLKKIFERVTQLIDDYLPDEMALEAPFFGKNIQSMLKLGRAQGVAMAAALAREIPIVEYAPKKVKQSVTGNGNASKEQVAAMLKVLLKFDEDPKLYDATDALGVAMCHYFQVGAITSSGTSDKKVSGWGAFIADNPNRVK
ncbi:crossover junction endodeoxyribonuclease RuvC [Rhodocytophaga rosea]|uniref:Crossover junction endodeoxyribonuclease RuvC n=1 Tax=Rhodocytophaga rosea TaxID=2704465 RepID=A0A6C0GGQ6_9BACT|nr:crossover junction endodeoxyribonuclease RuvC [Rhodocytophaga rosea]QHT67178.1 crossover junction endodeoxyribonuclease RuvC [Rhodocytophaga rosea]